MPATTGWHGGCPCGSMNTLIGERLGQYQIAGVLGRGGMATVYRAHQERLGRDVALKVLRASPDPQAAARFEREARAVASLSHPNILPVYDYGEEGELLYIVMQLIEGGRTLATRVAEGPMAPAEAVELLCRVLDALGYAHGRGVIHRDIKPANILLPQPDWPLLGDFGIAQSLAELTQLTVPGEILGTPSYMAPERATGQPSDARADLYAVGALLYELLTGRAPFEGDSAMAVLIQHVQDAPLPPSQLVSGIPPALERVALKALEKDPGRRYQSAAELAAALRVATIPAPSPVPAQPLPSAETRLLEPDMPVALPRSARPAAAVAAPIPVPVVQPGPPRAGRRSPWLLLGLGVGGLALLFLLVRAVLPTPAAAGLPLRLDDGAWAGGFGGEAGSFTYGGRSAVVAYGQGTPASELSASFELAAPPAGAVALTLEGMDSEGPAKTAISIVVNGQTIYSGPNPLPDDDYNLDTGTWARHSFPLDPAVLRAGANSVTITNRSPGGFGAPPFIIIDYALIE